MGTTEAPGGERVGLSRGPSLRWRLIALVVASVVPLLVFILARQYVEYQGDRANAGQQTLGLARSMSLVVERELELHIAALRALSQSRALHRGEFEDFRVQAETLIAQQFPGANLIVLGPDGRQLLNTFVPAGQPLPVRKNLEALHQVFATGEPAVSNLYPGTLQDRLVVGIDVPVKAPDGTVLYDLSINPAFNSFARVIREQHLPDSWAVAVFDRRGLILARSPNPERFIGHAVTDVLLRHLQAAPEGIIDAVSLDGVPVLSGFSRVPPYNWGVAIGVPLAELVAPAMRATLRILAVGALLLALSLFLALFAARRIIRPIGLLRGLAAGADKDRLVAPPPTGLPEADDVAEALRVAEMERRHSADEQRQAETALRTSEQKLNQAQKMEAIGNLTGGLAHDFNNLLGVIIGNLDLLKGDLEGQADLAELAGEALDAALRGADLTQRLLAFARHQPLQPQRVAVNELITGIFALLSRTLGEDIRMSFDLAPDIWPVVVDPAQLQAGLTNLATNARDAMPRGGALRIATACRHLDADYAALHSEVVPGDYVLIEIGDSGGGMTPDVTGRIFDPFFTTKAPGKGTGLGLSMVFGFIKQSGGNINVYSEVGVGTIFRLYLPRAFGVDEIASPPAAGDAPPGRGETVLAVEDNAALRRVVARQLRELGYYVIEADNPAAALSVLEGTPVDLLFTDIVMPGGQDGFDLAQRVLESWPMVKIVLTTGFSEAAVTGRFQTMPPSVRLISKPYRKDDLAKMLREALDAV